MFLLEGLSLSVPFSTSMEKESALIWKNSERFPRGFLKRNLVTTLQRFSLPSLTMMVTAGSSRKKLDLCYLTGGSPEGLKRAPYMFPWASCAFRLCSFNDHFLLSIFSIVVKKHYIYK